MSDSRPVNIEILGAARVAIYAMIAPARTEPLANLSTIAARDPERAAAYAKEHGIPRVLPSYEALMTDPDIELVYVATPPAHHARLAIAALAAGKHVLVEKPFAMSAGEAESVARAADAAHRHVFEAMHSRHHRLFARIVEIVGSGTLGKITKAQARFDAPIVRNPDEFRWHRELGGGALMDLGVYPLAWLRGALGEEPKVVCARAALEDGVDTETEAELIFPSGATAIMHASMTPARIAAELTIEGTKGVLGVTNPLAPQMGHLLTLTIGGQTRTETVDGSSTFAAQLAHVCDTVRRGTRFTLPERDYVRSMAVIDSVRDESRR